QEYDVVVKGTKFNVSAYPDDSYITTTLQEGVVELNYKEEQIRMSPGESISLDLQTGQLKGKKVNAWQAMAWAEDRIEYDDITLGEMVKKLSRQYDVRIQLGSEKLGDMKFRVSLRNKETIVDVMDALKEIIPIKVEYKEKDIYIR
ncbi:FecR family protein, partial [Bacteroides congonensis]